MKKEEIDLTENNLSEIKDIDPQLVQMVKFSLPPTEDVPDWVEKNVMNAYRKKYRYKIFYRKVKKGIADFAGSLVGTGRELEILFAGILFIVISLGIYLIYDNKKTNTEKPILITANENKHPNYRNSNSINNLTRIEIATIVYIEKSDNENDNKLINNIAKKLSENSKKSISMDKDIAYEIILNIKINKNIVTLNIGDAMDNILFTKEYDITDKSLEEMANIISTNLLTECKLK